MVQLGGRGLEAEADASDLLAAQGAASWTFHLNRRKVSTRERLGASDLRIQAGACASFSTYRADVAECSTAFYDPARLDRVLANGPAESIAPRAAMMAELWATGERDPERLKRSRFPP